MEKPRLTYTRKLFFNVDLIEAIGLDGTLLYQRLWSLAEDSAVYLPRYNDIALEMGAVGRLVKMTGKIVEEIIEILIERGNIIRFSVEGVTYHWIRDFLDLQKPEFPDLPRLPLPPWLDFSICATQKGGSFVRYKVIRKLLPPKVKYTLRMERALGPNGQFLPRAGGPKALTADDIAFVCDVIGYFNEVCGTKFTTGGRNNRIWILARRKEGHTLDSFKGVIKKKYAAWGNDVKMRGFLRPETLFGATKFEGYVNEPYDDKEARPGSKSPCSACGSTTYTSMIDGLCGLCRKKGRK